MQNNGLLNLLSLLPDILAMIAGFIASRVFYLRYRRKRTNNVAMIQHGLCVPGHVVIGVRGLLRYTVVYTYTISDEEYTQTQETDGRTFQRTQHGDIVQACYLPEKPEKSVLKDVPVSYIDNSIAFFLCVITAIYSTIYIVIGVIVTIVYVFHWF